MDRAAMIGMSGKTVVLLEFFQIKHGAGNAVVEAIMVVLLKFKVVALMKVYI